MRKYMLFTFLFGFVEIVASNRYIDVLKKREKEMACCDELILPKQDTIASLKATQLSSDGSEKEDLSIDDILNRTTFVPVMERLGHVDIVFTKILETLSKDKFKGPRIDETRFSSSFLYKGKPSLGIPVADLDENIKRRCEEISVDAKLADVCLLYVDQQVGHGVFANESISVGKRLFSYVGTIHSRSTDQANFPDEKGRYLFGLQQEKKGLVIVDAFSPRNYGGYTNHSFNPNAEMKLFKDSSGKYVVPYLVALRNIEPGEEITWDYGYEYWLKSQKLGISPKDVVDDKGQVVSTHVKQFLPLGKNPIDMSIVPFIRIDQKTLYIKTDRELFELKLPANILPICFYEQEKDKTVLQIVVGQIDKLEKVKKLDLWNIEMRGKNAQCSEIELSDEKLVALQALDQTLLDDCYF